MPEISVIVPVYNTDKFLSKCIESILSQSYHDFELLLIDDGSTDKSSNICDEYGKKDARIRVIHQRNSGVTLARKRGWVESKGNWIVFVDSDDLFLTEGLNILIIEAIKNNCEIVNASMQSQPGGRLWIHKKLGILNQIEYFESFIYNQTFAIPVASIYKKSIFQDSTFNFDPSIKIGEDVLMKIELALRVSKIENIPDVIYYYIDNESSVMNRKIRHPDYYERYYRIMYALYDRVEGLLNKELEAKLNTEKFKAILYAIFSPHIKYDSKYLQKMRKELFKNTINSNLDHKTRIYSIAMKNKNFTWILKKIIYLKYIIENGNLFRKTSEIEVLY